MVKEGLSTNGDEENLIVVFLDAWLSDIGAYDLIVVKSSHVRREGLPPKLLDFPTVIVGCQVEGFSLALP